MNIKHIPAKINNIRFRFVFIVIVMLVEINEDRECIGKEAFDSMVHTEYVHDEEYDCYLCPNDKILMYTTTTRNGYRQYKSDPKDCKDCPLRNKCTKSKNMTKVIERHLWEEFRDMPMRSVILWSGKKFIHREKKPLNEYLRTVKKTMDNVSQG